MKHTLSRRIVRALLLRLVLLWLLCVPLVAVHLKHELEEKFDETLKFSTRRMFNTALFQLENALATNPSIPLPIVTAEPLFPKTPLVYQMMDANGKVLLRSHQAPLPALIQSPSKGFHDTQQWRLYVARHPNQALFFVLADARQERYYEWQESLVVLLVTATLALAVLAWTLPRVATREVKVLQRLQQQIRQRGGGDLRPLELDGLPAELQAVGEDVNLLLHRLTQALQVERALAANAAHELRTPLTTARLRLQTALEHGLHRTDIEAAVQALLTLSQRTEKLLQLSRAESSAPLARQRIDLQQLAETVAQEFTHEAAHADRLRLLPLGPPHAAWGDFDALAIALRNLVENALRYAGESRVDIIIGPAAQLAVRDSGPGVNADKLHTLQQRHVRQSAERTGYGLGLSIVATIAHKSAAQLMLFSPPEGQTSGFEARLVLPSVG